MADDLRTDKKNRVPQAVNPNSEVKDFLCDLAGNLLVAATLVGSGVFTNTVLTDVHNAITHCLKTEFVTPQSVTNDALTDCWDSVNHRLMIAGAVTNTALTDAWIVASHALRVEGLFTNTTLADIYNAASHSINVVFPSPQDVTNTPLTGAYQAANNRFRVQLFDGTNYAVLSTLAGSYWLQSSDYYTKQFTDVANQRANVNKATLDAGEDITNNCQITVNAFLRTNVTANGTTAVKASAGYFQGVRVLTLVSADINIYDGAAIAANLLINIPAATAANTDLPAIPGGGSGVVLFGTALNVVTTAVENINVYWR